MKALVIDDDRDHRETVSRVLQTAGWDVEVAEDGVVGLGRVPQARPDLILLDVRMPNLDGAGMLELLRSTPHGRAVPVVLVTGADLSDEVRGLADAVLMKPFDPVELLRLAARLGGGARRVGARRA